MMFLILCIKNPSNMSLKQNLISIIKIEKDAKCTGLDMGINNLIIKLQID